MKTPFLLNAAAAMLFHLVCTPMAFGVTGQEVLAEIQSRYEKADDFEASFLQEYIGKVVKGPPKGEGKVYFKKKGMMRWDYRIPNQKVKPYGSTNPMRIRFTSRISQE